MPNTALLRRASALAVLIAMPGLALAQAPQKAPTPAANTPAAAPSADSVVASVNGKPITQGDLAIAAGYEHRNESGSFVPDSLAISNLATSLQRLLESTPVRQNGTATDRNGS